MGCNSSKHVGADDDYTVKLLGESGKVQKCIIEPGSIEGIAKPVNHREGISYALLKKTPLGDFIPKFYGRQTVSGEEYLLISDLSKGFKSPCLANFLVGKRLYGIQEDNSTIESLINIAKNSTTALIGVKIDELKMMKNKEETKVITKEEGEKLTTEQVKAAVSEFLPTEHLRTSFVAQMQKLIDAMEKTAKKYPGFRLYGSSVLVTYDGDEDPSTAELRVGLIDFHNMYLDILSEKENVDDSYDDGVIYGCKRLKSLVPQTPKYKIVLLRHGESQWNLENKFTGWYDCELSEKGVQEAHDAGKTLKEEGFTFTLAYTSVLRRAINTFKTCDGELESSTPKHIKDWHLNERMYGGLTGLNKKETVEQYGEQKVNEWRRSYDIPPPECPDDSPYNPRTSELYAGIDKDLLPKTESLKDCVARVLPYWEETIKKSIKKGEKVIIVAHGNSLRSLVMYLDGMSKDEIAKLNIPTAVPLLYELDDNCFPISHRYLGDQALIDAKINAVKNQTKANPSEAKN